MDCFEDKALAERIYTQPFRLADVTTLDDGEILQHRRMALLELVQKHIRHRDMSELLNEIVAILSYNEYTDNQVMTMMNYLIQEGNATNPKQFITEIAKQSEKHEGALMTMAQKIEEIGMQKGKLEGIQEGIQEGEKKASLKIARQLLESGMERQSVRQITGLSETEMKTLFQDSP